MVVYTWNWPAVNSSFESSSADVAGIPKTAERVGVVLKLLK